MIPAPRVYSVCAASLLLAATGCGGKPPTPPAAEVNLATASTNLFAPPAAAMPAASPTAVVARVDDQIVTRGEVDKEVAAYMARYQGRVPPEQLAQRRPQLEEQARENLIIRRLLETAVAKAKIEVPAKDIDAAVADIRASAPPGATLEQMLEQGGQTMETFRTRLTEDMRINKLIEQNATNVPAVTDEELQKYYAEHSERFKMPETVQASHILLSTKETDTADEKKAKHDKLEKIRERIVAGEDFAQLAGAESDCPSKARGGDLGVFPRGKMVPVFEEAAFSQKVGEVGPVIESPFGYHIIKVAKHDEPHVVPMDEVKDRLRTDLQNQRSQQAAKAYVDGLRAAAKIELVK